MAGQPRPDHADDSATDSSDPGAARARQAWASQGTTSRDRECLELLGLPIDASADPGTAGTHQHAPPRPVRAPQRVSVGAAAPPPQRAEGAAVQGAARRRAPARGHDRADDLSDARADDLSDARADARANDGHERAVGGADLGADVADGGADESPDKDADGPALGAAHGREADALPDVGPDENPDVRADGLADGHADADGVFPQADRQPDVRTIFRADADLSADRGPDVHADGRADAHAGVLR